MTAPPAPMPPLVFSVQGRSLTAAELKVAQAGARRQSRKTRPNVSTQTEATHNGWRVLGHAPGRLEEAQRTHQANVQRTPAHPFDPAHWRMSTRKTPVNVRPYSVEQAALECAALARRSGWLDVVVEPITKGTP